MFSVMLSTANLRRDVPQRGLECMSLHKLFYLILKSNKKDDPDDRLCPHSSSFGSRSTANKMTSIPQLFSR